MTAKQAYRMAKPIAEGKVTARIAAEVEEIDRKIQCAVNVGGFSCSHMLAGVESTVTDELARLFRARGFITRVTHNYAYDTMTFEWPEDVEHQTETPETERRDHTGSAVSMAAYRTVGPTYYPGFPSPNASAHSPFVYPFVEPAPPTRLL